MEGEGEGGREGERERERETCGNTSDRMSHEMGPKPI